MKRGLLLLLTGFALGAVTVLLAPGNLNSRLPKALGDSKEVVSGTVVAKKSGSDELLLAPLGDRGSQGLYGAPP